MSYRISKYSGMYELEFIEWLILTSDFKLQWNGSEYWYERNDAEDSNGYKVTDVYEWWKQMN